MDSEIALLGFAGNDTGNPDAFVLVNLGREKKVRVRIRGTSAVAFTARRTCEDGKETFSAIGTWTLEDGAIIYAAPAGSVTTFFAKQ